MTEVLPATQSLMHQGVLEDLVPPRPTMEDFSGVSHAFQWALHNASDEALGTTESGAILGALRRVPTLQDSEIAKWVTHKEDIDSLRYEELQTDERLCVFLSQYT